MSTNFDFSSDNVLSKIREMDEINGKKTTITHLPGNWDFRSKESKIEFLQKNVGLFFVEIFLLAD